MATLSNARAGDITYSIIDYPAYETDALNGQQDTISGTIITDGTTGPLSATDIVGGTVTLTNPLTGSNTLPLIGSGLTIYGLLTASQNTLTLPIPTIGTTNQLYLEGTLASDEEEYIQLQYVRYNDLPNGDQDTNGTIDDFDGTALSNGIPQLDFNTQTPNVNGLSLGDPDWIIAVTQPVPEPATLTLFGSALLGLGVVYLRQRRAKA
jgi:hypothetical protein